MYGCTFSVSDLYLWFYFSSAIVISFRCSVLSQELVKMFLLLKGITRLTFLPLKFPHNNVLGLKVKLELPSDL